MHGASLLIVEDDPIVATDLQESLQEFGYKIVGIERSGEKAVEKAIALRPQLVLMDITLEGKMDGIAAAERIQAETQIPIIYLTAHSDEATLKRARITQPYAYVLKPFEEVELRIAIDLAIYRRSQEERLIRELGKPRPTPLTTTSPGPDIERLCNKIQNIQPFSRLPRSALLTLLSQGGQLRILQGDEIDLEEERFKNSGFTVLIGRMAVLRSSYSGRELIVELMLPGDTFGLFADTTSDTSALRCRAQADTHLVFIPRNAFLEVLASHPELYRTVIDDLARRLREAHNFARALAHDRVEVRIASALLRLGRRFSPADAKELTVPLTRQELADLTGTTVETAIRVTRSMEKAGIVDLSQTGTVKILDAEQLERMFDE